ncbi:MULTISPECIES: hypothetical protein [unclassified Streptomyces]|uniref:hypothetical protein n=1 Tax=unclassified Streptomyces TaxID=2593676 RepID=UPI0006F6F610|nr:MULTISPECIES: hypothetical protein [unclassified Streptomyces]KQX59451.1 hypothetical protein ASD33_04025 [Streptomyces sp. Root1304]KRB00710.1 hypothetical protein ASE09_04030 [Streptomyces sp. Root66D1]
MSDETHTTREAGDASPRRSTAGQLRLQLPQQSAPVERGRHPESGDASGVAASGLIASLLGDILPF